MSEKILEEKVGDLKKELAETENDLMLRNRRKFCKTVAGNVEDIHEDDPCYIERTRTMVSGKRAVSAYLGFIVKIGYAEDCKLREIYIHHNVAGTTWDATRLLSDEITKVCRVNINPNHG